MGGSDLRVPAGRLECEDGVVRRVAGVDEVVRRARVIGIALEDALRDRRRPHLLLHAAARVRVDRERVEERHLIVLRQLAVQAGEPIHPRPAPRLIQGTRRLDQAALHRRQLRVRRNLRQRGPARRGVLLAPDRMIVRHRLAPESDRAGRGFLGLDERLAGVLVDEGVQREHAFQDALLACLGPGGGEVRDAEAGCEEEGEHAAHLIPLDRGGRTRYGVRMKTLTRSRLWRRDSLRGTSR